MSSNNPAANPPQPITQPPSLPPGQTPPGTDPPGQTPNNTPPPGQTPGGTQQRTSFDSLPPDIQDYIKTLRKESEDNRKALDAKSRADKQAEDQRLKEQGEFKQLAEKHETRVKELEPIAQRYEALAGQIREQVKAETKDWPAEVKAFYPGDEAPVEQVQEWYTRSKPLMEKLQQQARGGLPGNGPNPQPANQQANTQRVNAANRDDLVKRRGYGI